jgi:hypothetical protein
LCEYYLKQDRTVSISKILTECDTGFHNIMISTLFNYIRRSSIMHTVKNNYYAGLITKLAGTRPTVGAHGPR